MEWKKLFGFVKHRKQKIDIHAVASDLGFGQDAIKIIMQAAIDLDPLYKKDLYSEQSAEIAGVSFKVNADEAENTVAKLQSELKQHGCLAFICDTGDKKVSIGIVKGNDQFEILKIQQTNGDNYDISNEDVIAKMREWNERFPLTIIGADFDWVEAAFQSFPKKGELKSFAKEIYQFCPDIVDQGTESIEGLMEDMKESRKLYLWWD